MKDVHVIRSSCRMCHGVCQVLVHMEGDKVIKVTGDPDSPTSRGYICPKGMASPELLYHPERLTKPMKRKGARGENKWTQISWEEAINEIVQKLDNVREKYGPEYFAMMQGTGRPYTLFNGRFANAFGTPNYVSPGHICFFPRVSASGVTMGGLPISDIYGFGGKTPKCQIIWGCNIADTGAADGMCGNMLQRSVAKAEKVIVIDPRRTNLARFGRWLAIRPGTDGALALAMIHVIVKEDLIDHEFVKDYTFGYESLVEHIKQFSPEWAESITGIDADEIRDVAKTYAMTKPASIQWGNGVDMNNCALHTARAILILRAITGNLDRPGGDVLWVTPENLNSVSPLENPAVLGMEFLTSEQNAKRLDGRKYRFVPFIHPPTFWKSVLNAEPYRIKALWVMGSNPLVTQSHTEDIEKALTLIDFIVVSDFFLTPTAQYADIVLPSATWLEQNDIAYFHKLWCILSRKKAIQIGKARDDREVVLEVAHRLGLDHAFPWKTFDDFLDWILEGTGSTFEQFCEESIRIGKMRYSKYCDRGFHTPSGKFEIFSNILAQMGDVSPLPIYREPSNTPVTLADLAGDYPLILTSAKVREFFHSEGRNLASLRRSNPEPLVEIHPETAANLGVKEGDWVWIETPKAKIRMQAALFDGLKPNVIVAQHGWWFPEKNHSEKSWRESNINFLYGDTEYDPETGSESLRSSICRVKRC
jgi:anaerobic selenocysteine-containing dehydrogenase